MGSVTGWQPAQGVCIPPSPSSKWAPAGYENGWNFRTKTLALSGHIGCIFHPWSSHWKRHMPKVQSLVGWRAASTLLRQTPKSRPRLYTDLIVNAPAAPTAFGVNAPLHFLKDVQLLFGVRIFAFLCLVFLFFYILRYFLSVFWVQVSSCWLPLSHQVSLYIHHSCFLLVSHHLVYLRA